MGVETLLLVSAGLSVAQGVGAMQASKREAKAIARQGALEAQNIKKATLVKSGEQRQSFLSSGLELSGSPLSAISSTIETGRQDVSQTLSNARIRAANELARGRAAFLGGLAQAGFAAFSSGVFSGAPSAATPLSQAATSSAPAPAFGPNARTFTLG